MAFQVFKLSRKVQLDIIHGNGEETFFLPFIKKITGSKFVLTSHSPFIPQTGLIRALKCPTQMLKRLNFYLLRAAAIRADLLLTYSNFSRRLVEDGIRGKYNNAINTISPGVDPSWFKVSVQKKEKISNGRKVSGIGTPNFLSALALITDINSILQKSLLLTQCMDRPCVARINLR